MKPPGSVNELKRRTSRFARNLDIVQDRGQRWVAFMVFCAALERAVGARSIAAYFVKGGVAVELRQRTRSRATKDIDIEIELVEDRPDATLRALDRIVDEGFRDFTFAHRSEPHLMPNGVVRAEISVSYIGKSWAVLDVDVHGSSNIADSEAVTALPIDELGIAGPETVPCLTLPMQIAQKLHAATEPDRPDRTNDRFRDLLDVILLTPLVDDVTRLEIACRTVFSERGTHPWPPTVTIHERWKNPLLALAKDLEMPFHDAGDIQFALNNLLASALGVNIAMKKKFEYKFVNYYTAAVPATSPYASPISGTVQIESIGNLGKEGWRMVHMLANPRDLNALIAVWEREAPEG